MQKVPIPQGIGTQIKKHFSKMCSLHPLDAEHKGLGTATSILNLIFRNRIQIASWYQLALLATTMRPFCPQFVIFRLEKNAMAKTKAEEKALNLD